MRLDHLLSKEHFGDQRPARGLVVYSSFLRRSFWGDGASDCGTLTIRFGSLPGPASTAAALRGGGVEGGCGGGMNRGALLGPEESGWPWLSLLWWLCGWAGFSGSLAALVSLSLFVGVGGWCGGVAGAGFHQTAGVGV